MSGPETPLAVHAGTLWLSGQHNKSLHMGPTRMGMKISLPMAQERKAHLLINSGHNLYFDTPALAINSVLPS